MSKKITGGEVMAFLIPQGGWIITENDFDSIVYDDGVKPITKKQFEDAFEKVEMAQLEKAKSDAAAKQALLEKLGITEDEAKLLLS